MPTARPGCSTTVIPSRWPSGRIGPRTEGRVRIPARSTLLMYTDGLIERRRQSLDDGIVRPPSWSAATAPPRWTNWPITSWRDWPHAEWVSGRRGFVGLPSSRPLELTFPPTPHPPGPAAPPREWLAAVGLDSDKAREVLIAAEAVTKLDRTRPPRRPGRHHHPARQRGRRPVAGDHHRHRLVETRAGGGPVAPGPRIAIMRAFMEDVSIVPDTAGTTVRMATRDRRMSTQLRVDTERRATAGGVARGRRDRREQCRGLRRALRRRRGELRFRHRGPVRGAVPWTVRPSMSCLPWWWSTAHHCQPDADSGAADQRES